MPSLNKYLGSGTYHITIDEHHLLRVTHVQGHYRIDVQKETLDNIAADITLDDASVLGFQSIKQCQHAIIHAQTYPNIRPSNIANESSFIDFSWLWDAFLAFLVNVGKALGSTFSAICNIQSWFPDPTIHDPYGKPDHYL